MFHKMNEQFDNIICNNSIQLYSFFISLFVAYIFYEINVKVKQKMSLY